MTEQDNWLDYLNSQKKGPVALQEAYLMYMGIKMSTTLQLLQPELK